MRTRASFQGGVLAASLGAALAGCASPLSGIEAPIDGELYMTVVAHGVQVYECRDTPGGPPAWMFVAPQADLFDSTGRRIGHHGAGPAWHHLDGSGFSGTLRARADAPQPGAIAWLLLRTRPHGARGLFSRVSHVQRVDTVAGQAPADGCSATALGARVLMAYRATYRLYTPPA